MGNHQSSDGKDLDKETVIQNLWKSQRAIPVLPLNPNLDALRVLTKHSNDYRDVGNVTSLSKPGQHQGLSPRKQKNCLTTKSMGEESYTIADNRGVVATKLTNAREWFQNATSIEIRIPKCWVRECSKENLDDMVHHFNPDMQKVNSKLKNLDRNSERELFIVQKVVLVSHITITAKYSTSAGPDVRSPSMSDQPSGLQIKPRILDGGAVEFTISGTQENQKLPIAFSAVKYTYDKFGELKSEHRTQADTAGASSSQGEAESEDDEESDEEGDEENVPADDADMGDFLNDRDWFTQIVSEYNPTENVIFDTCDIDEDDGPPPPGLPPPGPPVSPAGSPPGSPRSPRDPEDID